MGLNVANRYTFHGPFTSTASLADKSGVYLISVIEGGIHKVLDIGESANLRDRVTNHDRKNQWVYHAAGQTLHCSTFYCDEEARMMIEFELRSFFAPPCGLR